MKKYDLTAEEMLPGREEETEDGFELHWTGWKQMCNQDAAVGQWIAWNKLHTYGYVVSIPGMICAMIRPGATIQIYTQSNIQLMCSKELRESLIADGLNCIKKYIIDSELNRLMSSVEGSEGKDAAHVRYGFLWKPKLYSSQ